MEDPWSGLLCVPPPVRGTGHQVKLWVCHGVHRNQHTWMPTSYTPDTRHVTAASFHTGTAAAVYLLCSVYVCMCALSGLRVCVCVWVSKISKFVCERQREHEWQNVCNPHDTAAKKQDYWWKHWSQQKACLSIAPAQLPVSTFHSLTSSPPLSLPCTLTIRWRNERALLASPRHYDNWVPWASWIVGGGSEQEATIAHTPRFKNTSVLTPVDRSFLSRSLSLTHLEWFSSQKGKRHFFQYRLLF